MNISINILHILFSLHYFFLGSQNLLDDLYLIENLILLRLSQSLCSPLGLESAMYSRPHPASYKSFCFSTFSDPGPSSGVKLIPFPMQSMAMLWYRTRILSTSSVAKEVTSKLKSKRNSGSHPPNQWECKELVPPQCGRYGLRRVG